MFKSRKEKVLSLKFEKQVPCSADVLLWNYWDGEHLEPVHGGYKYAYILYQGPRFTLCLFGTRAPLIPITVPTLAFVIQNKKYEQLTYAIQLILLSKTTINIYKTGDRKCTVNVHYQMILPKLLRFLYRPLRTMVPKWFERVYNEDLPLRIRRQRVLDAGFVDYVGMQKNTKSKSNKPYEFKFPLVPAPGSNLMNHPFCEINTKDKLTDESQEAKNG